MTRVVLTQPQPRAARLAAWLGERQHETLELSTRRLVRLAQVPAPDAILASLPGRYDWVVFVSPGAIEMALGDALPAKSWPRAVGVAVVGPGSARALAERGVAPPVARLVSPAGPPYDASALLATPPFDAPAGLRVLVVNGEGARVDWLQALRGRGATVDQLRVYRSEPLPVAPQVLQRLREWAGADGRVVFVFTAVDAVRAADALLAGAGLRDWAHAQPVLAVHPRIAAALSELRWTAVRLVEPGDQALLAGIESI